MKYIFKKLYEAQAKVGSLTKSSDNPYFNSKYVALDQIQDALKPILAELNLMIVHSIKNNKLITTLIDIDSDEKLSSSIPLTALDPQKRGSEITYFKRYNLSALFNLAEVDDDANSSSQAKPTYQSSSYNKPTTAPSASTPAAPSKPATAAPVANNDVKPSDKQISFARQLKIVFDENTTRSELTKLIDIKLAEKKAEQSDKKAA